MCVHPAGYTTVPGLRGFREAALSRFKARTLQYCHCSRHHVRGQLKRKLGRAALHSTSPHGSAAGLLRLGSFECVQVHSILINRSSCRHAGGFKPTMTVSQSAWMHARLTPEWERHSTRRNSHCLFFGGITASNIITIFLINDELVCPSAVFYDPIYRVQ